MENRGNIWVPNARRRAGLAQKTKPHRFITEVSLANDFQRHRASQIYVERFVSDPHRAATQLDRLPVFASHQFIMLKALSRLFQRGLDRILGSRRLTGLNPASESLAQHAHRTGFHRSRKLIAAARTGALGVRAHRPSRPSAATSADSNTTLAPSGAKSASTAPVILLSRCTSNRVFLLQ